MFQPSTLSHRHPPSDRLPARTWIAAALAASSLGWGTAALAQTGPNPPAAVPPAALSNTPAPQAASTAAQPASASSVSAPVSRPEAFVTAPSLKSLGLAPTPTNKEAVGGASADPVPDAGLQKEAAVLPSAEEDAPWLLDSDHRPWALAYLDVETLNSLYLMLPAERDARIMLPGAAQDFSERAATEINRYFTDNNGLVTVARARQLETLNTWLADTAKKKMALPKDPWVDYQFHKEANTTLQGFKAKVARQSDPGLMRMASDIKKTVDQITTVMNATGSHEQKMRWYNLLLQLKDGFTLFQSRVTASDRQLLDAIARYEAENPQPPRPAGQPPRGTSSNATAMPVSSAVTLTPDSADREKAPMPPKKAEDTNPAGGWIVILGMLATVLGLFYKMRKRVSGKPSAPDVPTN